MPHHQNLNATERTLLTMSRAWERTKSAFARVARSPLGGAFRLVGRLLSWWHRCVWSRFAYRNGRLNRARAGLTIAVTILTLWIAPTVIGWAITGVLMATTWHRDEVILTFSEEIDSENDVHSMRGCRSYPCSEQEAIYYRVRRNLPHDLYSFFVHGHRFFPEDVSSVVAPGANKCIISGYGIRVRAMRRGWGVYPNLMHAVCTPYQEPTKPSP